MNFSDTIIAGAIGGLISLLLLPFASYLFLRLFNRWLTVVEIEFPLDNSNDGYITHPIRIRNNTFSTLKNVTAYILIKFAKDEIGEDPNLQTYTVDTSDQPLMLSWAKVTEVGNRPNININQGESADLNLFRHHKNNKPLQLLQISSEQGFSNINKNIKGRVLLKLSREYPFSIYFKYPNI
jgi:hypothetical protein